MVPFNKLMLEMTLICLFLNVVLSHDQIFFESMENGHADCTVVANLLNLGDTQHVWGKLWWIISIDYFKRSHASENMIIGVVPPFR
jgi:hypothetical protein